MNITPDMAYFATGAEHLIGNKNHSYQELKEYLEETFRIKKIIDIDDSIHIKSKNGTFTVAEKNHFYMRLTTKGGRNFWVRYNDFNKKYRLNPTKNNTFANCKEQLDIYKNLVNHLLCRV